MITNTQFPTSLNISLEWTNSAGVVNKFLCIERKAAIGSTFYNGSADITADVSNTSDSTFIDTVAVQMDERITITDNNRNVYYLVTGYTILNGTSTPARV